MKITVNRSAKIVLNGLKQSCTKLNDSRKRFKFLLPVSRLMRTSDNPSSEIRWGLFMEIAR